MNHACNDCVPIFTCVPCRVTSAASASYFMGSLQLLILVRRHFWLGSKCISMAKATIFLSSHFCPIFAVSQNPVPIGSKLIGIHEMNGNQWHYHASMMEEFVQRAIIAEENIEVFKTSYKDPDEFCCLFVLDKDFASFVYIPFPED